jgi:hypothetical protein
MALAAVMLSPAGAAMAATSPAASGWNTTCAVVNYTHPLTAAHLLAHSDSWFGRAWGLAAAPPPLAPPPALPRVAGAACRLIVTAALLPRPPPQLVQVQVQELREALVQYVQ